MDTSNIIDERTRGATKPAGTYQEPGDEEVRLALDLFTCLPIGVGTDHVQ